MTAKYTTAAEGGLLRITAARDLPGAGVLSGTPGGLIETVKNLSQAGDSWVHPGAMAVGDSCVCGDAQVEDYGVVKDGAVVGDDAVVSGGAVVGGWSVIRGDAEFGGTAICSGYSYIDSGATISGTFYGSDIPTSSIKFGSV